MAGKPPPLDTAEPGVSRLAATPQAPGHGPGGCGAGPETMPSGTPGQQPPSREADVSRDAERRQLPAELRRDVRLLGDLLGEVIREAGGQDLLDDVERLRRAVIAARERPQPGEADRAGDEIAAMVARWPLARAELVAKAFTIYFHLTNLAEERHRVRTLRGQADLSPGLGPRRESLAAAVAQFAGEPDQLHEIGRAHV